MMFLCLAMISRRLRGNMDSRKLAKRHKGEMKKIEEIGKEKSGMKPYANLHLHSIHSDGKYTPRELVRLAKEEGYKALALTDHDIATGFAELKEACEEEGMEYLFGVEFSVCEPKDFHIVGFEFDPEYPPMKRYLGDMGERQTDNTRKCFEEAAKKGNIAGITWEEVLDYNSGVAWLCNEHVFRAMRAKGLVEDCQYMSWFETNFLHQRGKYPPSCRFKTLPEVIALIRAAGGFAVVAHPAHTQLDDIALLMECGIEGIEVWHPDLSREERERAYQIGIRHNLYISGGSDHSGICGGLYGSYASEEVLKKSPFYIEPLSAGTPEVYFREMKQRKKER